ncbi:hypothetical protein BJX63DRAFT_385531 [Aspergillus granulosus]|uniref:NmrA-like domain-containing protein n=1 Tax=Aspergillus granulosus TaxID=176169 RepID=A0ABR4HSB1_9EURO
MSTPKLIVVLGATGTQGGSVVNTFLSDNSWRIRGLTRNTSSSKAQALKERGVEVVEADLDDPASLEAAFQGASAIYSVTDFWNSFASPELRARRDKENPTQPMNIFTYHYEVQQGRNVFDAAAKIPTLERLIYSNLADCTKWSKGKYPNVWHFCSKQHAADYGKETYPELWKKTSLQQAGFYLSNFNGHPLLVPQKVADGVYHFISGLDKDVHLPWIAAEEDTGPAAKALLESPPGKHLIVYREWLTPEQFVEIWSRVLGVEAHWIRVPDGESIPNIPEELVDEMKDNWAMWNEFGYEGRDDPTVIHPRDLEVKFPQPSVEEWMRKQDWSAVL